MPPAEHQPATDAGLLGRRYRLLRRIDPGGSLETWEALDERLDRGVVLRFLAPEARADAVAAHKLRDIRRTAASTPDPGLPRLLDGGEDESYGPYVVFEANATLEATQRIPVHSATGRADDVATVESRVLHGPAGPAGESQRPIDVPSPSQSRYGLIALVGLVLLVGVTGVFLVRMLSAPAAQQSPAIGAVPRVDPTAQLTPVPTASARAERPAAAAAAPTARPTLQPTPAPTARAETARDSAPVATIQQHYALIDARRYAEGYALMDAHLRSLNTPADYASWFANKVSIKPTAVDLVSQTGDAAVVRAEVTTTDRMDGREVTRQVAEQFDLHLEDGAWRIDKVTPL